MLKESASRDVSALPTHAFGSRTLTWWGTLAFMSLEGMGFALASAAYLYLMVLAPKWPLNSSPPDLGPGTWLTIVLIASVVLNKLLDRWACSEELVKVRWGLVGMSLFGIAPLIIRGVEFAHLNVRWDSDAYGSAVWFLLGLHTTHILTDVVDTLVLTALMFTPHGAHGRRFSDVSDNAFYWDFVVLTWLPIYFLIYWVPRL
jgi:heme/copper-type cytochrome/quinol oxidase subunit 3